MALRREMGLGSMEAADALWEGQTLLKTHRQTHKSETVYPPVSLRSLGRYKNFHSQVENH